MIKIKETMTPKNAKALLFASLIVAMILPFSTMNVADAVPTTQEDTKQKKIGKLELKLQDVKEKITSVNNKKAELEQKLAKAQGVGNQERVKKLQDAIDRKEQNLSLLEDKKTKFNVAIAVLKGDTVSYDDLSATIDAEIMIFVNKLDRYSDDPEKVEKLNQRFADKMEKLQDKFEPMLDAELEKTYGTLYSNMTAIERSDMAYYIISDKFKLPMQEKFESDMATDDIGFSLLGFEILQPAYAKCNIPTVTKFKQLQVDTTGQLGFEGDNSLLSVTKKKLNNCLMKYTLVFKDEDHPNIIIDANYDLYRMHTYGRLADVETFFVKPGYILFQNTGSADQNFWILHKPIHHRTLDTFSNTVYVSNTWNHLMDTTNTNPTYSMKTWYK